MNRSALATLFIPAALAAQAPATPVQELKPAPPPPATAQEPAPAAAPAKPAAPSPQAAPASEHTPPRPMPVPAPASGAPLSFASGRYTFYWDRTIPLALDVDGLKVSEIYFNVRRSRYSWLKEAEFGTRAHVTVTNTSARPRIPGFAVAVLDADGQLLGVASGGTKVGTVAPGATEDFDLNFTQVKERLPKGATFLLSVELRD